MDMGKLFLSIIVWSIIAGFFYAAIWTNEKITVSTCWFWTGSVAIAQLAFTVMSYAFIKDE